MGLLYVLGPEVTLTSGHKNWNTLGKFVYGTANDIVLIKAAFTEKV